MAHLEILLGDLPVGALRVVDVDYLEFTFHDAYLGMADRPILGQYFEDDLRAPYRRRFRLPFFSNLLPEGRLRALLHATHGLRDVDDVRLLALLGDDLPGAVRALPAGDLNHAFERSEATPPSGPADGSSSRTSSRCCAGRVRPESRYRTTTW